MYCNMLYMHAAAEVATMEYVNIIRVCFPEKEFLVFVTNRTSLRLIISKSDKNLQKQELERQFEQHIKEHELLILKICRMYAHTEADRQDLFQEIVIQLWKAYHGFKGQSQLSTYLYRIAINTAISGLRRKKDFIDTYEPVKLPQYSEDDTNAREEEQWKLLERAIENLNEVEKAVVMLYMEDKSYKEMEDILGISQVNLRVKMNRIKEKLRQLTKNN